MLIITKEERSVRIYMIYKFTGIDVDDMIFESSEEIVSER